MPDAWELLSSALDVELAGTTTTLDIQRVTGRAKQSGVAFTINFPPIIYNPESVNDIMALWAEWFNATAAHPNVAGVYTRQDVDAANQIVDQAVIVVASDSGRSTTEVVGPYSIVDDQHRDGAIGPVAANLNAVERG